MKQLGDFSTFKHLPRNKEFWQLFQDWKGFLQTVKRIYSHRLNQILSCF